MENIWCLRCMNPLHDDYHLIFDETGIELQLDKLLADHFEIYVEEDIQTVQALCEECVNKLIELYDLKQKNQEQQQQPEQMYIEKMDLHIKDEVDSFSDAMELNSEAGENETVVANSSFHDRDDFMGFPDNSLECVKSFDNAEFLEELGGMTMQEYVRQVIKSELEEIDFNQNTICRICEEVLKSHTAVLMHVSENHETESKKYPCISCYRTDYCFSSIKDLAFHIVLKHYDLDIINIYCTCPECEKRFSTFIEFNKHSCYKEKVDNRLIQECGTCLKQFSSNKRYRFHLQFHLEKHRAKACFICDIMFSDENDFFEHIMYAHENKDSLICKKCDRICSSKKLFEHHMKLHKAIRSFQCDYCSKTYLYKQMLMNHIERHHSGKQLHICKICEKSLASKHLLNRHMQVLHYTNTEANMFVCSVCGLVGGSKEETQEHIAEICFNAELSIEQIKIAYACEFCENAFNSVENLKTHRGIHSEEKYTCWICASVYSEFKKLKTHIITHDKYDPIQETFPVNRHYVCNFESCSQSYLTWPSLRSHKIRHETDAKFACEICNQTFRTQSHLNNHLKAHNNNEQYPCQFCSKLCASSMSLAVHISRKHNNNCKICPTCKATYPTEEILQEHIRTNHIELKCEQCGKETKSKRNLDIHIRMVHTKVKRYFCSSCKKGYYNKGDLKVHERTAHSEAHKYKCEQCDFTTSYEMSFKAHLLKHAAEKPFKCGECAREFTRKACFKLHVLRHTDAKPFECPVEGCGRSFISRGIRNSHLRDNHPGWVLSSSPTKTIPKEVTQPSMSTDYDILEFNPDNVPLQLHVGEQGLVIFDSPNVDQGIILECTNDKSGSILDLNHLDGTYNID